MKIIALQIFSTNLQAQTVFYAEVLGLKMLSQTPASVQFELGHSTLTLIHAEDAHPYHFAINIPANQAREALAWLKKRVPILKSGQDEIQQFDFWNAEAIYFYDRDHNIVEFIARKNLENESPQNFGIKSLLGISEIGMPVVDIAHTYHSLTQWLPVPIFDGGFERFCAMGDEHGLFICINKERKDWFPTDDKAYPSSFEAEVVLADETYLVAFDQGEVRKK